jgi:hypothetical protein
VETLTIRTFGKEAKIKLYPTKLIYLFVQPWYFVSSEHDEVETSIDIPVALYIAY